MIRKHRYLVTPAVVSPTRNSRSRAQTSIFTIENRYFLVQMAPQASRPLDVSAESLEARSPQPGVLSQASSARILRPGVLSQDSAARKLCQEFSARNPQPGFLSQQSPANLFRVRAGIIIRFFLTYLHSRFLNFQISSFPDFQISRHQSFQIP